MSNIHVCLQVDSSSNKLPYKCLLPIQKLEAIKVIIKRIQSKKYTVNIITSNSKSDDYLCDVIKNENVNILEEMNIIYSRL